MDTVRLRILRQYNFTTSFSGFYSNKKVCVILLLGILAASMIIFSYYDAFAAVTSAVWDDPDDGDRVISAGDTLTITFDTATDRPGGTGVQTKSQVDSMISFENSLGANYTGQWISTTEFRITIVSATGAAAQIGDDVFRQSVSSLIFALTGGTAFVTPLGVTANSTDFIFVADFDADNVQIFNPDGTFAGTVSTTGGTAFVGPNGIATNSTDFIFVADSNADNVQIFHPNGTTTGVNLTGGTAFSAPRGVATNSTDFIFVADSDADNVQIFNPDGTFAGAVSTTGGTAFVGPRGVATNSTDFIFVADSDADNVQIFNPDGTFAAVQPTTGGQSFLDPELIGIDNDDRLIVPDSSRDIVQVFGPASIQNTAQTALVFTNTQTTSGNFGLATVLTTVAADDPDNGDAILSAGDTLVFTFNNPTNATVGGTMTLAEINGNFTFGGGAKTIGTAASGVWNTASQITITINSGDGDIEIGDAVGVAGSATISDDIAETATFTSTATISGDFGVIQVSSNGGGGGGGDTTPPSFTTGSSTDEPILQINGNPFTADDIDGGLNTITAQQGETVSFEVALYDNGGSGNIQHIDLFIDQGRTIRNDLTETYITYDNGETSTRNPHGIIQSADITKSQDGNRAVFSFDVVFAKELETSDVLIQVWDIKRNAAYLHVQDIISIVPGQVDMPHDAEESVQEQTMPEPSQTTKDISEINQTIRKWAGYDSESATDGQLLEAIVGEEETVLIPHWIKDGVAELYVTGEITYDEFAAVIHYMYQRGLLIS